MTIDQEVQVLSGPDRRDRSEAQLRGDGRKKRGAKPRVDDREKELKAPRTGRAANFRRRRRETSAQEATTFWLERSTART
jgi:hypothetical protein